MGGGFGLKAGFAAGVTDSLGSDMINTGKVTGGDVAWAAGDGLLGAGENAIETGMSKASLSGSLRWVTAGALG
jgi:hypothetical protein